MSILTLWPLLAALVLGLVVGWLWGRHTVSLAHQHLAKVRDRERQEADAAVARLRRDILEGVSRTQEYAETFTVLPETVRDLFQARTPRALVPPLVRFVDLLLQPEQLAFFAARPGHKKLALAQGTGLPNALQPGFEIEFGQGRVGYVAENRVCMDDSDFRGARGEKTDKAQDVKRQVEATEVRGLRPDVVAPIAEGDALFGVVSVGGVRQRKGLEKKLLLMVTELAALSLANAERMRLADEAAGLDGMTGLVNRRLASERLDQLLQEAERDDAPVSVLMVDIDHFRHYNDTNGHVQGDDVLRQLSKLLRSSVRADDVVARYAGEEFLVIFPRTEKEVAVRLADQLRAAVEAYPFPFRGLQPKGAITLSGGVSTFPRDSRIGRELIRCADQALFDAKGAGRNQVSAATPSYLA